METVVERTTRKIPISHVIESIAVTFGASAILAWIYNGLGMGDLRQLFWVTLFTFATTLGSFASEYGTPGSRPRLWGSAVLAMGFAALVLSALPALPSNYRLSALGSGIVLLIVGGGTLILIVRRETAFADGHDAPVRAAVATASSVVGVLGGPFLTYLTLR